MSLDFNVLTSIRSDPILLEEGQNSSSIQTGKCLFLLLDFHRDRLVQACKAFQRNSKVLEGKAGLDNLHRILQAQLLRFIGSDTQKAPIKLRLEFTKQEYFHVILDYVPTVPLVALEPTSLDQIPALTRANYRIFISPEHSRASLFTKHKTTYRSQYDKQRALLPIISGSRAEADILQEMLLINQINGEIMEGTITTPYFCRNGEWLTPSESCGGHMGVTRRWALTRSLAKEGSVLADDILVGEIVILSNGVRGFGWGRIAVLEGQ